jgi:hypothetical protein
MLAQQCASLPCHWDFDLPPERTTNLDVAAAPFLARAAHWAEQEVKRKRRPWAANLPQQHHKTAPQQPQL